MFARAVLRGRRVLRHSVRRNLRGLHRGVEGRRPRRHLRPDRGGHRSRTSAPRREKLRAASTATATAPAPAASTRRATLCRDAGWGLRRSRAVHGHLGELSQPMSNETLGTGCTSDGNPCTLDQCNGTSVDCQHPPGNAGDVCHAALPGECDIPEHCTGSSPNCPGRRSRNPPAQRARTMAIRARPIAVTARPVSVSTRPATAGTRCRGPPGRATLPRPARGTSDTCPPDVKHPASLRVPPAWPTFATSPRTATAATTVRSMFSRARSSSAERRAAAAAVATLPANCPGNAASCPPPQTQNCAPGICSGNQCGGCTTNSSVPDQPVLLGRHLRRQEAQRPAVR